VSEENLYRVLQVDPEAESEVVDAAYRRLARKYHPDSGGKTGSEAKMRALNAAYEVLSDAAKRRDYDAQLASETRATNGRATTAKRTSARPRKTAARAERPAANASPLLQSLEGATLRAEDGTYLGLITADRSHPESIANAGGAHGSEESDASIRNPFGKYGSPYGAASPFNRYSRRPPVVERNGRVLGYLTTNPFKQPSFDPHDLLAALTA
jgi:curved DNA-binding protein CbpA